MDGAAAQEDPAHLCRPSLGLQCYFSLEWVQQGLRDVGECGGESAGVTIGCVWALSVPLQTQFPNQWTAAGMRFESRRQSL